MALLHLEALPRGTTKGTIVRLLVQVGEIDRGKIGAIELRGRNATIEVPDTWATRLVKVIDGANLANHLIRACLDFAVEAGADEDHFQRLIRLLDVEADAEAEQALRQMKRLSPSDAEGTGLALIDLVIIDEQAGLGGRCLVTLRKKDHGRDLPFTRLGTGSPVLLTEQEESRQNWRGVVSERDGRSIQVAFSTPPEPKGEQPLFRLDLSSDEIARQRQRTALQRAATSSGDRLAVLRQLLLGETHPTFGDVPVASSESMLDPSQQEAVRFALSADDFAIIHGPPGTGKTTTVVELICRAVESGKRVLACAPSNLAVDNMFEKLLAARQRVVRLGHPARVLPQLRDHTLDLLVDSHPDIKLARKLVREAFSLRDKASKYTRAKPEPGARREMRAEAKQLMDDARRLEAQVVQQILDSADILCATLTGIDSEILGQRFFDMLVIDEACQSTEPACWIPLMRCDRVVLAGDHKQLPPTVVSQDAMREGFGVSLLERLMQHGGEDVSRQLVVQYRMHEMIMEFSSHEFYDGTLIAHESVRGHLLRDLPGLADTPLTASPIQFIDTAGAGYDEQVEPDGESRMNESEAELVVRKVEQLIECGLERSDIAVIAPYSAQVRLIRGMLRDEGIEVDTVDGFQGREKEAVLISLVRSNPTGEIGFLADVRRMNVALTRARRKLVVVGDSATVGAHPFYQRMLEYFEAFEAYHTVWEEM